jgi:hypothetical protein
MEPEYSEQPPSEVHVPLWDTRYVEQTGPHPPTARSGQSTEWEPRPPAETQPRMAARAGETFVPTTTTSEADITHLSNAPTAPQPDSARQMEQEVATQVEADRTNPPASPITATAAERTARQVQAEIVAKCLSTPGIQPTASSSTPRAISRPSVTEHPTPVVEELSYGSTPTEEVVRQETYTQRFERE